MEFGIFVQGHVPRRKVAEDPGYEHTSFMHDVDLVKQADRHGFKYAWLSEHHFLEEYSHLSASEVFLGYLAGVTERIHLGSAIWNISPPVNHPVRVAERVAMMDHLSEGRFEFGTGRGAGALEVTGFGIESTDDIHFIQIKTGALTTERITEARQRRRAVVTTDTYKSMAYARAVAALGIGVATGEIPQAKLTSDVIVRDFSVFSNVASTSSGVELMNCEIIALGNSTRSASDLVIAHAVMKDAIDAAAVREALRRAGLSVECELAEKDRARLVNVFAKCEPDPSGATRGRRHVMFEDGDINYTRHIRGVVNAVVASVTGDTMCYVSAGAEHQGPPAGGVVAVLARAG